MKIYNELFYQQHGLAIGWTDVKIRFVFAEHILPTHVHKVAFVADTGSLSTPVSLSVQITLLRRHVSRE